MSGALSSHFALSKYIELSVFPCSSTIQQSLWFRGARPRTKADLSKTMYANEVEVRSAITMVTYFFCVQKLFQVSLKFASLFCHLLVGLFVYAHICMNGYIDK